MVSGINMAMFVDREGKLRLRVTIPPGGIPLGKKAALFPDGGSVMLDNRATIRSMLETLGDCLESSWQAEFKD